MSNKNQAEQSIEQRYAEKLGVFQGLAIIAKDVSKRDKAAIAHALTHLVALVASTQALVALAKSGAPWWYFLAVLYVTTLYAWLTCRKKDGKTKSSESG